MFHKLYAIKTTMKHVKTSPYYPQNKASPTGRDFALLNMMKRILTKIKELTKIPLVGQTQAGSGSPGVQLATDSQPKTTNCRRDEVYNTCHPVLPPAKKIRSFLMPKKTTFPTCCDGATARRDARQSPFGSAPDRLKNEVDSSNSRRTSTHGPLQNEKTFQMNSF